MTYTQEERKAGKADPQQSVQEGRSRAHWVMRCLLCAGQAFGAPSHTLWGPSHMPGGAGLGESKLLRSMSSLSSARATAL